MEMNNLLDYYISLRGFCEVLVFFGGVEPLSDKNSPFSKSISHIFLGPSSDDIEPLTTENINPANGIFPKTIFFESLNVALGYVDGEGLAKLRNVEKVEEIFPGVDDFSIILSDPAEPGDYDSSDIWATSFLGLEQLWTDGLTGSGVKIGHLDTGIADHPLLINRISQFGKIDSNGEFKTIELRDSWGHGTHTAGLIASEHSEWSRIGVAPKCELFSAIITGSQSKARLLGGLEWLVKLGVDIINLSVGIYGYSPFWEAIFSIIRNRGILPVVAIGNKGPGTSYSPGNYPQSLSVGAIDRKKKMWDSSSSDIFRRKQDPIQPDIVAPGVDIISTKSGGGFEFRSGTSLSAAFVSGIAALILEASPQASVEQVETAIRKTAKQFNLPQTLAGSGVIQPVAALKYLQNR